MRLFSLITLVAAIFSLLISAIKPSYSNDNLEVQDGKSIAALAAPQASVSSSSIKERFWYLPNKNEQWLAHQRISFYVEVKNVKQFYLIQRSNVKMFLERRKYAFWPWIRLKYEFKDLVIEKVHNNAMMFKISATVPQVDIKARYGIALRYPDWRLFNQRYSKIIRTNTWKNVFQMGTTRKVLVSPESYYNYYYYPQHNNYHQY